MRLQHNLHAHGMPQWSGQGVNHTPLVLLGKHKHGLPDLKLHSY